MYHTARATVSGQGRVVVRGRRRVPHCKARGSSLAERRVRWAAVNPPVQMDPGQRRKRRKIEERARHGRFEYEYAEGDPARFRLDAGAVGVSGEMEILEATSNELHCVYSRS